MMSYKIFQLIKKDKLAIIGLTIILILAFVAVFAPYLAPYDPTELNLQECLSGPTMKHPMGTDQLGRDYLSRIIYGTRVSLTAATVVTLVSTIIGVTIGTISGYFGGVTDEILMRVVDTLLAFPSLILAIVIAGLLGPSLTNLMIAMVAIGWVSYSRIIRGSVLSVKEQDYIVSAKAIGCSNLQVTTKHIIPNVITPVIVLATLDMGYVILGLCGLSFLGLGAQPPTAEWGSMLNAGKPFMESVPCLMIFPGLMIMLTVLAFNFLGDGLRDALDPRLKKKGLEI
jgi:peptide/nickel transport system permease protein